MQIAYKDRQKRMFEITQEISLTQEVFDTGRKETRIRTKERKRTIRFRGGLRSSIDNLEQSV